MIVITLIIMNIIIQNIIQVVRVTGALSQYVLQITEV